MSENTLQGRKCFPWPTKTESALKTVVFRPRVGPEFAARALAFSGPLTLLMLRALSLRDFQPPMVPKYEPPFLSNFHTYFRSPPSVSFEAL